MINAINRRQVFFSAPLLAAVCLTLAPPFSLGQSDSPSKNATPSDASSDLPKYDVATIKPASGSDGRMMFMFMPGGINISGVPVQMLLREAFNVEDDRIVSAPGWVKTNRYDVQAKVAPEDAPKLDKLTSDQRRAMLLPLLVERFNLKYHHEMRELPSYALVVAKGGPKMKLSAIQDPPPGSRPPGDTAAAKPGDSPAPGAPPRRMMGMTGRGHVESQGSNTEMLARILSSQLGRTVVDKTGLTANYDYTLQWTPDDAPPPKPGAEAGPQRNDSGNEDSGPSLFTAVQEQLGLKLEAEKGTVDVIVIDHIDTPSEN